MAVPAVTCSANVVVNVDSGTRLIQLAALATESPTAWEWTVLSAPLNSTAMTGVKGDFTNGVAIVQNPQLLIDGDVAGEPVSGTYVVQCVASNAEGPSDPLVDKQNGQQLIVVLTEELELSIPNDYAWDWGFKYLNPALRILEARSSEVRCSDTDVARAKLEDKLVAGANISLLTVDAGGGVEKVQITAAAFDDEKVKASSADTTPGYLNEKLLFTDGLTPSIVTPGGDEDYKVVPNYGSAVNTVCQGNDSRLSDARTPTAHASSHDAGGGDAMTIDAAAGTGSLRTLGTAATAACAGNDSRLSDARTPVTHAASHKSAGGDAIKLDELAAPTDVTTLDATTGQHGLLPKLGGGSTNFLRADGTWSAPAGTASPLTTKGDLYTYDTGDQRLAVGTNGQALLAASGEATGLLWGAPAPASHAASHNAGGGDGMAIDAVAGTGSLRTLGTAATAACAGNDARLSDARTPSAHAASHKNGGGDEVAAATPAPDTIPKSDPGANTLAIGWIPLGTTVSTVCVGNDARLSDARTPASHAASHKSAGGDAIKLDELDTPTDVTTLNATTGQHGLLPKLGGGSTNFLRADGTWAAPVAGFASREQEYTAAGGDENFTLSVAPATNANMLSGYTIIGVFRNGVRSRYQATPSTANEYGYTHGGGSTKQINCKSLVAGDIITVVYGS